MWYFIHDKNVCVKEWDTGGFSHNGIPVRYTDVKTLNLTSISEHTNQFQVNGIDVKGKPAKL